MVRDWKSHDHRIAFVPTMGNLHEGHLTLVRQAQKQGHKVVVSIFVNPLQFAPGSDYERYPRTLEQDKRLLIDNDVQILFVPKLSDVYPSDLDEVSKVVVPKISNILCGEFRPGHFEGVTTVVAKLFNLVQPDVAYFGEKDYQQLTIIRKMVTDLCFPIVVHGVATVRDSNGLALSSRNQYLDETQCRQAVAIYEALSLAKKNIMNGGRNFSEIQSRGMQQLEQAGLKPEYFSIRQAGDLSPATQSSDSLVILAAAWLGQARLIDNMIFKLSDS